MLATALRRGTSCLTAFAFFAALAAPAGAGWILEWTNVASNPRGVEVSSEASTMYVAGNRVRTEQAKLVSITDYRGEKLTFLDPARKLFWSGSVSEYVTEMKRARDAALNERMGKEVGDDEIKTDLTKLPKIEVKKADETQVIAGHPTARHEIRAGGHPFQDMWVAADLDLGADLDPQRFLSLQSKMSQSMIGKSATIYNALYRDEAYRKLLQNGFALRLKTSHIAGSYERTATSVRTAEVADELFGVPNDYRRVRLEDVFPKEG